MKKYLLLPLLLASFTTAFAQEPVVKKSTSGICHDKNSSSYNRTKNFTPFDSVQACLNSGGTLPKNQQNAAKDPLTGQDYEREYFGHGWSDDDGDCINTRHEILLAHSINSSAKVKEDNTCSVATGLWLSPFTGDTIDNPSALDIDHIAPLKFAWENGAATWSYEKRVQFANDPENLLAVEASLNRSKGAQDITQWLPPANQCEYIDKFLYISDKYGLVFSEEKQKAFAIVRQEHCPS